jgi:aldose 1-epimerase
MKVGLIAVATLAWASAATAAQVTSAPYAVTQAGDRVTAYTLTNDKGASATILDFGGTVADLRMPDRDGKLGNVVMSFSGMAAWETLHAANGIVGRVANRVSNGFALDGVRYDLKPTSPNGVTMHSGPPFYATRLWAVAPIKASDGAALTLSLDSPDGDQGLPGHVAIKVTYRLTNDNALRLDYWATTDKATPINLDNHLYVNLAGADQTSVATHDLQVATDRMANEAADAKTPSLPLAGTPFDFRRPAVLAERLAFADSDAWDDPAKAPPPPAGKAGFFSVAYWLPDGANRLDRVAARLHDPASGRVLEVRTTEISVHLYTPIKMAAALRSERGRPFTRVPAIAIETQHLPDSPNRPDYPSVILRPGQTFHSTTIFAFGTDRPRR